MKNPTEKCLAAQATQQHLDAGEPAAMAVHQYRTYVQVDTRKQKQHNT